MRQRKSHGDRNEKHRYDIKSYKHESLTFISWRLRT